MSHLLLTALVWMVPGAPSVMEMLQKERGVLFERLAPSVVFIKCDDHIGSGFVVHARGWVMTNKHVATCVAPVLVFWDGTQRVGKTLMRDAKYDLALVAVEHPNLPAPVPLMPSEDVAVGQYVAAVSHPLGSVWSLNDGLVSNLHSSNGDAYLDLVQTQLHLLPGSSGGPVVNRLGELVCVHTAGLKDNSATGFCIGSGAARKLLQEAQLRHAGNLAVSGVTGAVLVVDGKNVGAVPKVVPLEPGRHSITVTLGKKSFTKSVDVTAGGVSSLMLQPGELQ